MPSLRQLTTRIRSVQTTSKLTKAMQAVAAMRLRKYSQKVVSIQSYARNLQQSLVEITKGLKDTYESVPALRPRTSGQTLMIIVAPSRGFCGGLHRQVVVESYKYLAAKGLDTMNPAEVTFITINKPAQRIVSKLGGQLVAFFNGPFKNFTPYDLLPISELVRQMWLSGKVKEVIIGYAKARAIGQNEIKFKTIMPVDFTKPESFLEFGVVISSVDESKPSNVQKSINSEEIEPSLEGPTEIEISIEDLVAELLPQWLEMNVHLALSETQTAEEGARMVAMSQATDNAKALSDKLKLAFAKQRQAKITQEISEIIGGSL